MGTATKPVEGVVVYHPHPLDEAKTDRIGWLRTLRRLTWSTRRAVAPLYVAAAVAGLGVLVDLADIAVVKTLVVAAVVTTVLILAARGLGRSSGFAGLAAGTSGLWVTVVAGRGMGKPMPLVLVAVTLVFATVWWWRHRIRPTVPSVDLEDAITVWLDHVGAPSTILPGSQLIRVEPIEHGWAGLIVLPRGKFETGDVIARTGKITSAYELPLGSVIVEPTADRKAHMARLTVLPENPLYKLQKYPGPSLNPQTGLAQIGLYADGELVPWRFWMPGSGTVHFLVAGATGSGKSRFLDQILAEARHSGLITTWLIDPQRGQSMPDWIDNVDRAATTAEEGLEMLRAAQRLMYARSEFMANLNWTDDKGRRRKGKGHFDPTPEIPILLLIIDETAEFLAAAGEEAVKLLESIAKLARKTGIGLGFSTQMPSVSELGGSSVLRSMVSSGNVISFRTADRLSGQMAFQGFPVDPAAIPRELPDGNSSGGMGYLVGAGTRLAVMRTWFVDDPFTWATTGSPVTLDDLSCAAAEGNLKRAAAMIFAGQANLPEDERTAGEATEAGDETDTAARTSPDNPADQQPDQQPDQQADSRSDSRPGLRLVKPTAEPSPEGDPASSTHSSAGSTNSSAIELPSATGSRQAELTANAQRVYAALVELGGAADRKQIFIQARSDVPDGVKGMTYRTCGNALNDLAEAGLVENTGHGAWAITEKKG